MTRLVLASFYSKTGGVNEYFVYYLDQLRQYCDRLIVTVNGVVSEDGKERLLKKCDDLLIRENSGFDIGGHAYAAAWLGRDNFISYDEVILTNDTLYGLFIEPSVLIDRFEKEDRDFASPTAFDNGLWKREDSYLLFLKKTCLAVVFDFLIAYGMENRNTYLDAIIFGEQSLSEALWGAGFKSYTFCETKNNVSVMLSPYEMISKYGLPLLKRKCMLMAGNRETSTTDDKARLNWIIKDSRRTDLWAALHYIQEKFDYPLALILDDAKAEFGSEITNEEVASFDAVPEEPYDSAVSDYSLPDIGKILEGKSRYFIYGNGIFGARLYYKLVEHQRRFAGFVVSDGQQENEAVIEGEELYFWSDIREFADHPDVLIIVAMEKNTSDKVRTSVEGSSVLYLW